MKTNFRLILSVAFQSGVVAVACTGCNEHNSFHSAPANTRPNAGFQTGTPPVRWIRCATEGGVCKVPGSTQVRYGIDGKYATKTTIKTISCTNAMFGDPYPGVEKRCDYALKPGVMQAATRNATKALPTDAIFASDSFWYKPIPKTVLLDPKSKVYVAEFLRQKAAYHGTVSISVYSYTSPVYVAPTNAATTTVTVWDCQNKGEHNADLTRQWAQVPIPANARASVGTDGEMTVYQPSTNTLWEFWQMRNKNGRWEACWGGKMTNVSTNDGIWPNPYGTTATGLPFLGGQITAEELQRGEIRHVIGISLVDLEDASVFSWPATRSDGHNPSRMGNRIPQGTRFRLDPGVDIDALDMSAAGKVVAKAAQKYGFVVWDKAGAVVIRGQNAQSYIAEGQPDPYPALFDGKEEWAVLQGFPWDKLQFLPRDYGKRM